MSGSSDGHDARDELVDGTARSPRRPSTRASTRAAAAAAATRGGGGDSNSIDVTQSILSYIRARSHALAPVTSSALTRATHQMLAERASANTDSPRDSSDANVDDDDDNDEDDQDYDAEAMILLDRSEDVDSAIDPDEDDDADDDDDDDDDDDNADEEVEYDEEDEDGEDDDEDHDAEEEEGAGAGAHAQAASGEPTAERTPSASYKQLQSSILSRSGGKLLQGKLRLLEDRERGHGSLGRRGGAEHVQMMSHFLPVQFKRLVMHARARMYGGKFSSDGSLFMTSCQDHCIHVYDTHQSASNWTLKKEIDARDVYWTITDTDLSPDKRFLIYCTISTSNRTVDLVDVQRDEVNYQALDFTGAGGHGGLWSVRFSNDGREILAGAIDQSLVLYDIERELAVLNLRGHREEVNSVCFLDESGDLLVSASDDSFGMLWDRRALRTGAKPISVLAGHLAGITYVSSKNDGRYIITNSKDQSIKLWDIRKLTSLSDFERVVRNYRSSTMDDWDYRVENYPRSHRQKCPFDTSVMTYRGHSVLQTLIRCHFSPLQTTAQKYIYSGSHNGRVYIYDVLTGSIVKTLHHHAAPVRDVSWHPTLPMLCSASWDRKVALWGPLSDQPPHMASERPMLDFSGFRRHVVF